MTFGFPGSMTMSLAPVLSLTKSVFFHVLPPSVVLYTPSPQDELWRVFASPVPTHTTFGLDFDTAIAPIDIIASTRSKIGVHETPPFTLLNTPPLAAAT